jgi:ribosomal protein S27AE
MLGALGLAILLVAVVDQLFGHSTIAFAAAIVLLVVANAPMLRFNCPQCGKNAFFRGLLVVPWPNRICGRCGNHLDRAIPKNADG